MIVVVYCNRWPLGRYRLWSFVRLFVEGTCVAGVSLLGASFIAGNSSIVVGPWSSSSLAHRVWWLWTGSDVSVLDAVDGIGNTDSRWCRGYLKGDEWRGVCWPWEAERA